MPCCDDRAMAELYGQEHVVRYRATDGQEGHYWREALVLLLTTSRARGVLSPLHPWIVRGVGVHGRATLLDRVGAQFVVPGFVAVDPAQPVPGAVL